MAGVFTIGHSNHALADFLARLRQHAVTAVADVRSAPYSRFNPHFNREALSRELADVGFVYVYLGRELGGRSDDPACYRNGRIRYDRVAQTPRFQDGLRRLAQGMAEHRVALMCAEKEPLHCHRTLLVAQALHAAGTDVAHIHADGQLEKHAATMDRLLDLFGLRTEDDLFAQPRATLVDLAIGLQAERVGHVSNASDEPSAGVREGPAPRRDASAGVREGPAPRRDASAGVREELAPRMAKR